MKKIILLVGLFTLSLVGAYMLRQRLPGENAAIPADFPGSAPREVPILPSPIIVNDAPSQFFSLSSKPDTFPETVQWYSVSTWTKPQVQEVAVRLGFNAAPEITNDSSELLFWSDGERKLSHVNNPPSIKMTVPFSDTDTKRIPSPQIAENMARTFVLNSGVVSEPVTLKIEQSSYVNSDGLVFSPVIDPTKPTLVRVDLTFQINGLSLYAPNGYPLGATVLVSGDGVKMFMSDLLLPVLPAQTIAIRSSMEALDLLQQNKGVLVDVEKRSAREGTVTETSFSHFSVTSSALGYIWNKETNSLLPCYVFSGTAQSGRDMGIAGTYLVSGVKEPIF